MKKFLFTIFIFCLAVITLGSGALYAESYRMAATADFGYSKSDPDSGDETTANTFEGTFYYFFKEVSLNSGPYMESFFMQRAGYVTGSIGYQKIETGSDDITLTLLGINGFYCLPMGVGISLGGTYAPGEGEEAPLEYDIAVWSLSAGLGYYVLENTYVSVEYQREEYEYDFKGWGEYTNTSDIFGLNIKTVQPLNEQMSLNVEASFAQEMEDRETDDKEYKQNEFTVSADLYLTPKIGIGCGLAVIRGDNKRLEGNIYAVGGSFFVNQYIGIDAAYGYFSAGDDEGEDEHVFNIGLKSLF